MLNKDLKNGRNMGPQQRFLDETQFGPECISEEQCKLLNKTTIEGF